jgi:hypothetical protein
MIAIICTFDEEQPTADLDLRTRAGREQEALRHLKANGNRATVFWMSENLKRTYAVCRLQNTGKINQTAQAAYPWVHFEVTP